MQVPKPLTFEQGRSFCEDCKNSLMRLLQSVAIVQNFPQGWVFHTDFAGEERFPKPAMGVNCGCDCNSCPLYKRDKIYAITLHEDEMWIIP